jgi:hypothetical protein
MVNARTRICLNTGSLSRYINVLMRKLGMQILVLLISMCGFVVLAFAADIEKFNGLEKLIIGQTRFAISNNATYQCGQRLIFGDTPASIKNAEITFSVKTIPAERGECGCKAHTNNFHLYRSNRIRVDKEGYAIPDVLIAKGKIDHTGSRTFKVAAIHRVEVKFDYYINFLCTD